MLSLASASLVWGLGCGDDASDGSGGGGAGSPGATIQLDFASPACLEELCWVTPLPQGNRLRAVDTASDGTTYAVGDHGAVLRWDGARFLAAGLPRSVEALWTSRPQLLAVHARTPDDVWIAGASGVVLHLGPKGLVDASPGIAAGARYVAVHALAADDVWLVSATGMVLRFDGSAWSTSLSLPSSGRLVGLWARSDSEVWVFGEKAPGVSVAHLWDGSAWTEIAVTPESGPTILPAGSPVAITGSRGGEPRFAFEHQLVARSADGSSRTLYADPTGTSFPRPPIVAATTGTEGDTWLAFDGDATLRVDDAGSTTSASAVVATGFGAGPDGRVLLLRRGGGISDPTATAAPRRAIDPLASNGSCAAAGSDAICLASSPAGGAELRRFPGEGGASSMILASPELPEAGAIDANAAGLTAVQTNYSELRIVEPNGAMRSVSVSGSDIDSFAMTDDGSVYVVTLDCRFGRVLPGQSSITPITRSGGAPDDEFLCEVKKAGPNEVYLTALGGVLTPERRSVIVRRSDGSLLHDALVTEELHNYPIVAVTASGVPYYAGGLKNTIGGAAFRLENGAWVKLPLPSDAAERISGFAEGVFLEGYGERVFLSDTLLDGTVSGSFVHVLSESGVRTLQLPVDRPTSVVPSADGFFGVQLDAEPNSGGFSSTIWAALFRVAVP